MKSKLFDFDTYKVLVVDFGELRHYYMQATTSDWFFCFGDKTPIDEVTEDYILTTMVDYCPLVVEDEVLLIDAHEAEMEG